MPAISRELCGSHSFGGDSFPVGGAVRPTGESLAAARVAARWNGTARPCGGASVLVFPNYRRGLWLMPEGKAGAAAWGAWRLTVQGAGEGQAVGRARFARALYGGWLAAGESMARAGLHGRFAVRLVPQGEADALVSVWRSIYAMGGLTGQAEARAVTNFGLALALDLPGWAVMRGTGASMLRLHAEPEGGAGAWAGVLYEFSLTAEPEGGSRIRVYPLRYVEGMGLPLPVPAEPAHGPFIIIRAFRYRNALRS